MDQVLDAGTLTIRAVAVIAEQAHDGFRRHDDGAGRHVANRPGKVWKRVVVAVGHAHAAADQDVVADNLALLDDCQQAEILRVNIDAVIFRQSQARFEFPRQVHLAIKRFDVRRRLRITDRLAV